MEEMTVLNCSHYLQILTAVVCNAIHVYYTSCTLRDELKPIERRETISSEASFSADTLFV